MPHLSKLVVVSIGLATLITSQAPDASAQRNRRTRVSADVEHVISTPLEGGVRRAILGRDERGVFLWLDEVVAGRLSREVQIVGARQGRRWRDFGTEAGGLFPGSWNGTRFEFQAWLDNAWLPCSVELGREAVCRRGSGGGGSWPGNNPDQNGGSWPGNNPDQNGGPGNVPDQNGGPGNVPDQNGGPWPGHGGGYGGKGQDPIAAAKACDSVISDHGLRDTCVQLVMSSRRNAQPILEACEAAFDGDANELACMQTSLAAFYPDATIGACEAAFDGDPNELACLQVVANSRNPVPTITFCEERESGDEAELACLRKFVR